MNAANTTYLNAMYFSTLANVAAMILSIAVVFLAGYTIYLRQQRDRYREKINRALESLDTLIFRWSIIEGYRLPDWSPPISRSIEIMLKESWSKTPLEVLEQYLKEVESKYEEALKEEQKDRHSSQGELVAGPALYLEVKFALDRLLNAIYREFPAPPGDYMVVEGIPVNVRSFIKADFPRNRGEFLKWAEKFEKFFEEIYRIYMYRLRNLIKHLKEVHEESASRTLRFIEGIESLQLPYIMRKRLEELIETTRREPELYEKFFEYLLEMYHTIGRIKDMMIKYDNYTYKRKNLTIASLTAMALTGIAIPLIALSNILPPNILPLLGTIAGTGFTIATIIAILIIHKEITST